MELHLTLSRTLDEKFDEKKLDKKISFLTKFFLKTALDKIQCYWRTAIGGVFVLYFLKMCPIFFGPVNNLGKRY